MNLVKRVRLGRTLASSRAPTPIGALVRGMLAGAAGAAIQSLFFKATKKIAPEPTKLEPREAKPELKAQDENSLETVARRFVEGMMMRGPLDGAAKTRAAAIVHYSFGALWGGLYGLLRESARVPASLFGVAVWMVSDNLILPGFRVAAWPTRYKLSEHHYALHAHIVYGLGTAGAYALLRDLGPVPVSALPAVIALQARAWLQRSPPGRLLGRNANPAVKLFRQWGATAARA